MTGGSIGPSFYDPAYASPTYHQPRYARLPDDANQALVNDTFYLNDATFVLPDRSLVRRQAFQNLQNRYYRQILYGCTNPQCKAPTCLSRQKRLSRGPFRPYTILSARALATFLAAEDHPENGLCPHEPANLQSVSGPGPSRKSTKFAQKVRRSPESPRQDPAPIPFSCGLPPDIEPSISISSTTRATSGHVKSASPELRRPKSEVAVKSGEEYRLDSHTHKGKDLRSFAQCLFDTAAMKCLQLARVPDGYFRWMRWTPRERHDDNHDKDVGTNPTIGEQSPQDIHSQNSVTSHISPSLGEEPKEAIDTSTPEQTAINLGRVVPRPNSSHVAMTRTSPPTTETDDQNVGRSTRHDQTRRPCAHLEKSEQGAAGQSKDDKPAAEVMIAECPLQHAIEDTMQVTANRNTHIHIPRPQSLSRFTADNIQALEDGIVRRRPDLFEGHRRSRVRGRTDAPPWSCSVSHEERESYRNFLVYSAQSMTYILSNPEALMQSFVHCEVDDNASKKSVRSYSLPLMVHSLRQLKGIDFHPSSIFPSLWISLGYIYPDRSSCRTYLMDKTKSTPSRYDVAACHIAKIVFAALISWVPDCQGRTWTALSKLRAAGRVAPSSDGSIVDQKSVRSVLNAGAAFENEMALSIATRLVRAIAARGFDTIHTSTGEDSLDYTSHIVRYLISESFRVLVADNEAPPSVKGGEVDMKDRFQVSEGLERPFKVLIEWLRSVIMREWDGKPQIRRSSAAGSALELLSYIKVHCFWFDDEPEIFYTPFLSQRLNVMEMPLEWIESSPDKNTVHLLSYPFLFPPSVLVSYFRAINYAEMYKAFEQAAMAEHLVRRMSFADAQTERGAIRLRDRLRIAQSNYLVLEIRRHEVLTDAMDQLWRRQKRELMRPLQVRMGLAEGEEGVDHGGVQQEFFRVAVAEAMNPKYGAFTTDPATQMSWFQPGSLEPLYKFELLGLLTSLAVYNGLTLPFTFPVALYRKLLDMPVGRLEDIEDGWPELTKGLQILRDWPEDNVEEVFTRPYVFSINVFGTNVDVDMEKAKKTYFQRMERAKFWRERKGKDHRARQRSSGAGSRSDESVASSTSESERHGHTKDGKPAKESARPTKTGKRDTNSCRFDCSSDEDEAFHGHRNFTHSTLPRTKPHSPDSEPIMVNNANREEYIHDYIVHLVHFTVEPQWLAFRAGFFTCINRRFLDLFGPSTLKALVEGLPNIDVEGLERVTTYEGGYHKGHPTVQQLWRVVRSWPQEKVRQLLEFVTSSDRLPVGGVERLLFVVQKNGVGDGRLPSSSTCFGRLLLPEYTSEEELRQGLETAVENSKGFGQP